MARKVFISFLGTSNYVECFYQFNDEKSIPVRFVQEAIIRHLCKDWTEEDRIFIFCTSGNKPESKGSKESNWLDNGHNKIFSEIEKIGLEHRLKNLKAEINLKAQYEEIDIEAGFSEDEIWSIFNTVYSKLDKDDQIYFDVTHAFRSIPLFSVVLFNYSKFMKSTQLVEILYGAFEKLGPAHEVRKIPVEERVAPIIDLTNIVRLQEYNQIASNLKYFGRTGTISDLILNNSEEEVDETVKEFCNSIKELDEYIETIALNNIQNGGFIIRFRNNFKNVKKKIKLAKPILNILEDLNQRTKNFVAKKDFKNIEETIEWTINHEMLMQMYSLSQEAVCFKLAELFRPKRPKKLEARKYREFMASILGMPEDDFINKKWGYSLTKYPGLADYVACHQIVKSLRPSYEKIRKKRNSLDHGNGAIQYSDLINGKDDIRECLAILRKESETFVLYPEPVISRHIFLNLSNHPSAEWSKEQLAAANEYGVIEDLEFPSVSPEASSDDIEKLAEEYADKVSEKTKEARVTVHLMGEMTFTFNLLQKLQARGITCVASTTERVAKENGGMKTSEFKFIKFREY